ncbi:hypothetical protein UlMin_002840 [Ulmus minor]
MAYLCLNSLPLPPPSQPRKLLETTSLSSLTTNGHAFKPIVVTGNPPSYVSTPGHRIVADIDQARCALEIAGVLSSEGQDLWTGVLVQLEDILDRGENEIAILSLLKSLDIQAKAQGRAVNGNHETMNVEGNFRYVDPGSFDECSDFLKYMDGYRDDWEEAFADWIGVSPKMIYFLFSRCMLRHPYAPALEEWISTKYFSDDEHILSIILLWMRCWMLDLYICKILASSYPSSIQSSSSILSAFSEIIS